MHKATPFSLLLLSGGASAPSIAGPRADIKAGTLSDMHIHFSPKGDTAVASYVLHPTTQEANKTVPTEDHQETDVWFKGKDGWKIARVHYSDVPPPAQP
jgi:ketosteroid isomerase-like protein